MEFSEKLHNKVWEILTYSVLSQQPICVKILGAAMIPNSAQHVRWHSPELGREEWGT